MSKILLATMDAETDPFDFGLVPTPFSWGFYDIANEAYHDFVDDNLHTRHATCTDKLIAFLDTLENDYTVYLHNGGKFDLFFLLQYLNPHLSLINGRIAECSYTNANDCTIRFRDSFCILPIPLSAMEKDNISYDKFKLGERHKHIKEILAYQRKDCEYLGKWVSSFIDRFGMKITLASTAFSELQKTGYNIGKTFSAYDEVFRQFYFGGRVQTFSIGEHQGFFKYADINSAYPRAMLDEHPSGSEYMEVFKPPKDKPYFAIIDAVSKGALPYRDPTDPTKKLYFPNDDKPREYKVTSWEIQAGLDTGTLTIKKWRKIYVCDSTQNFKEYITKFYKEKLAADKSGDKESRLFSKLLMNAGYGKFGMDGRKFKEYMLMPEGECPKDDVDEKTGEITYPWRHYADMETGEAIFERDNPKGDFYNVATAASITGWVRAYLWRSICASKNVLYCDTDSIICEKFAGPMGDELGEWSMEATLDQVYIAQRKMYAVRLNGFHWLALAEKAVKKGGKSPSRWKYACKGIPKDKIGAQEIVEGVRTKTNIKVQKDAPAFSLKWGARFMEREISFETIEKGLQNNPD